MNNHDLFVGRGRGLKPALATSVIIGNKNPSDKVLGGKATESKVSKKITIIDGQIVSEIGEYGFERLEVSQAKKCLEHGFVSAVTGSHNAIIISDILGIDCQCGTPVHTMEVGDMALTFKIRCSPEDAKGLSFSEVNEVGFIFGVMERLS